MFIVCLESPFEPSQDDVARYAGRYTFTDLLLQNMIYARLALENAIMRGEAAIASCLLYPQVWMTRPDLREAARKSSLELHYRADAVVLCSDLGISAEMRTASDHAKLIRLEQTRRVLIDVTDGRDPRDVLAEREFVTYRELATQFKNAVSL